MQIVLKHWKPRPKTLPILYAAKEFAEAQQPVTVRQTFYHLVSIGMLQNTERQYDRLVDILTKAREAGLIPFDWIVDLSREPLIVPLYPSIGAFLTEKAKYYYRDTWIRQETYLLCFLEKQALQNIVWPIVSKYNIPLFIGKGYSSWPFIMKAAEELKQKAEQGKKLVVLYLGDCDPSGQDMPRDLLDRLRQLWEFEVDLVIVALTRKQVEEYNLPHQLLKEGDPRRKKSDLEYGVELDALDPVILRDLIKLAIGNYLDRSTFDADQELETKEQALLQEKVKEIVNELQEDEDKEAWQDDSDEDEEDDDAEDEEEQTLAEEGET